MENRVGDNVPSATKLADLQKRLSTVLGELRSFCILLSKDERQRRLRSRRDCEPEVQRVAELAKRASLQLTETPLDGMLRDLALAQALRPFEDLFREGLQLTEDTGAQADTEMWQAFLAHYAVLSAMGERNPELATALAPVKEFMRRARRADPKPAPGGE